jgi:hypothetical protein
MRTEEQVVEFTPLEFRRAKWVKTWLPAVENGYPGEIVEVPNKARNGFKPVRLVSCGKNGPNECWFFEELLPKEAVDADEPDLLMPKRKRGRPRKHPLPMAEEFNQAIQAAAKSPTLAPPKRGRGRPPKHSVQPGKPLDPTPVTEPARVAPLSKSPEPAWKMGHVGQPSPSIIPSAIERIVTERIDSILGALVEKKLKELL